MCSALWPIALYANAGYQYSEDEYYNQCYTNYRNITEVIVLEMLTLDAGVLIMLGYIFCAFLISALILINVYQCRYIRFLADSEIGGLGKLWTMAV